MKRVPMLFMKLVIKILMDAILNLQSYKLQYTRKVHGTNMLWRRILDVLLVV